MVFLVVPSNATQFYYGSKEAIRGGIVSAAEYDPFAIFHLWFFISYFGGEPTIFTGLI